jgi:hypothetical protein
MEFAMMGAAEGHGEVVTYLAGHGPWLGEADVVRIGRGRTAQEAGLRSDEAQVLLVADPPRFGQGKRTLLDALAGRISIAMAGTVGLSRAGPFGPLIVSRGLILGRIGGTVCRRRGSGFDRIHCKAACSEVHGVAAQSFSVGAGRRRSRRARGWLNWLGFFVG